VAIVQQVSRGAMIAVFLEDGWKINELGG